jgi:4-oxalocrotonate tautomerase
MSAENKKKIVEGITKVFEDMGGIPKAAITIIIYEESKANWATGGRLHLEMPMSR